MGAFAEHLRVVTERANPAIERRDIPSGVTPITGAGDNQLHYLQSEVQRLTRERDAAYATLDRVLPELRKLRSMSKEIEILSEFNRIQRAAACGVRDEGGEMVRTV